MDGRLYVLADGTTQWGPSGIDKRTLFILEMFRHAAGDEHQVCIEVGIARDRALNERIAKAFADQG